MYCSSLLVACGQREGEVHHFQLTPKSVTIDDFDHPSILQLLDMTVLRQCDSPESTEDKTCFKGLLELSLAFWFSEAVPLSPKIHVPVTETSSPSH